MVAARIAGDGIGRHLDGSLNWALVPPVRLFFYGRCESCVVQIRTLLNERKRLIIHGKAFLPEKEKGVMSKVGLYRVKISKNFLQVWPRH